MMIKRYLTTIAETLFPSSCLGCDKTRTMLCNDCLAISSRALPAHCSMCEKAPSIGGLCCPSCKKTAHLEGIVTASIFRNPIIRTALHALKFDGISTLTPHLATLLADALSSSCALQNNDVIVVPLPLHIKRTRERGFDQSVLLAEAVSQLLGLPLFASLLHRTRPTTTQTSLSRNQRIMNVRRAFEAKPAPKNPPTVIIIDDVITTGATLSEAAKTLNKAGWSTIWGAGVARAELAGTTIR